MHGLGNGRRAGQLTTRRAPKLVLALRQSESEAGDSIHRRKTARCAQAPAGRVVPHEPGLRRFGGRARGLCWLQKSTSGAWSRPFGHGSSLLAPPGAQRVNGRRKPGRGGESHEHASSDTGDRLLVIPRAGAQAPCATGGGRARRWKASWFDEAVVFDETKAEANLAIQGDGDAAARPDPRRIAREDVRGYVASSVRGRQHRSRETTRGGAVDRGSARTARRWSRHRSTRSQGRRGGAFERPFGGGRGCCGKAEAGGSPSSEAPPGWLIWNAAGKGPKPGCRTAQAQGESAHESPRASPVCASSRAVKEGWTARPGIGQTAGCS